VALLLLRNTDNKLSVPPSAKRPVGRLLRNRLVLQR